MWTVYVLIDKAKVKIFMFGGWIHIWYSKFHPYDEKLTKLVLFCFICFCFLKNKILEQYSLGLDLYYFCAFIISSPECTLLLCLSCIIFPFLTTRTPTPHPYQSLVYVLTTTVQFSGVAREMAVTSPRLFHRLFFTIIPSRKYIKVAMVDF